MARKRYISPEFFKDTKLANCSIMARYVYIGLWPHLDRLGMLEYDKRIIKSLVFPLDDEITAARVEELIIELYSQRRVFFLKHGDKVLLYVKTFCKHQKFFPDEKSKFGLAKEIIGETGLDAVLPAQDCAVQQHSTGIPIPIPIPIPILSLTPKRANINDSQFQESNTQGSCCTQSEEKVGQRENVLSFENNAALKFNASFDEGFTSFLQRFKNLRNLSRGQIEQIKTVYLSFKNASEANEWFDQRKKYFVKTCSDKPSPSEFSSFLTSMLKKEYEKIIN